MSPLKRCDTCGQFIPPKNPFLPGRPVKAAIYDYISAHPEGSTRAEVAGFVYKDHPDGGPENALTVISISIGIMNGTLEKLGLRIVNTLGRGATYHLRELK
jgi:hypothetical protein